MKLKFVEISGFRGFKDKTIFEFPGSFVVLTGRNGVGKSTVLDAVDFVLTGTINKFATTSAKGGGLEDHIWWVGEGASTNQYVSVCLVDDKGKEHIITRTRERGLKTSKNEIAQWLCESEFNIPESFETIMKTTLIRDEWIASLSIDLPEQARFAAVRDAIGSLSGPNHTKRTAALLTAASLAKNMQAERLAKTQADLGRTLGSLTEAQSLAKRQTDFAEAEKIMASLTPDLVEVPNRTEMLRRHIADMKKSTATLYETLNQVEQLQSERLYFESETGKAEVGAANVEHANAKKAKVLAEKIFIEAQKIESAIMKEDAFTSHTMALLGHGEELGLQSGHCPLCNALRTSEEFVAAIAETRTKLSEHGDKVYRVLEAVKQARLELDNAENAIAIAEQRLKGLESRQAAYLRETEKITTILSQYKVDSLVNKPDDMRRALLQRQEDTTKLEQALFIFESSIAFDRVTALESRVGQFRSQIDEETAKLTAAEKAVELIRQIDDAAKEVPNQVLTEQFDTVMPLLKELYQRLRPHADWREIETDFGGRIRASLNFKVGDGCNPQFLFSSGQRRAAGIAFLLAIHLSRPWCRLHSLLLDDPVQHIDDYRALNLVEVLSAIRRTGRQVIISVEDLALADVLCRRLRSTDLEPGRLFELNIAKNGSSAIERQVDIFPLQSKILKSA